MTFIILATHLTNNQPMYDDEAMSLPILPYTSVSFLRVCELEL